MYTHLESPQVHLLACHLDPVIFTTLQTTYTNKLCSTSYTYRSADLNIQVYFELIRDKKALLILCMLEPNFLDPPTHQEIFWRTKTNAGEDFSSFKTGVLLSVKGIFFQCTF